MTRWSEMAMNSLRCCWLSNVVLALVWISGVESAIATDTANAAKPAAKSEAANTDQADPKPDADGWYSLFNGKDFASWKKSTDNPDTFQVVNGEIVAHGNACHLYYDGPVNNHDFKNFEWSVEIMTKPHSNSGMYFHTKYQENGFPHHGIECQIDNTHRDPIRTGSLYKVANIMNDSPAKDDEWFTQTVIVNGQHVIVKINDKVVNDHTEPENPEREAGWENNVLSSGTFALQGHDPNSEVPFRNIRVKPLP